MNFGVSRDKLRLLRTNMRFLKIFEKEIEERFIRSAKPGGQNVNKVASCVQLKHKPTGIVVKCQEERQQGMNRFRAREILVEKVRAILEREERKKEYLLEREKRRERKRSKLSKENMLHRKHHHSEIKAERAKIRPENIDQFV